jgi:hypothetical protein
MSGGVSDAEHDGPPRVEGIPTAGDEQRLADDTKRKCDPEATYTEESEDESRAKGTIRTGRMTDLLRKHRPSKISTKTNGPQELRQGRL